MTLGCNKVRLIPKGNDQISEIYLEYKIYKLIVFPE